MRAAEAPFRARTSWGFSMSAPTTVPTMWTSLRNPSGNIGRNGRSIRRQVRIADSGARPSRRKNEPGILPAAYIRSSMSTVRGKKSAPGRGDLAPVAVTSTVERPILASTEPPARGAIRPVSNDMVFSVPLNVRETVVASVMFSLLVDHPERLRTVQWPRMRLGGESARRAVPVHRSGCRSRGSGPRRDLGDPWVTRNLIRPNDAGPAWR